MILVTECPACKCDLHTNDFPITRNNCLLPLNGSKSAENYCNPENGLYKDFSKGAGNVTLVFRFQKTVNYANISLTITQPLMILGISGLEISF